MQDVPLTIRFDEDERAACGAFGVQEMKADKGGCRVDPLNKQITWIEAMEGRPGWSALANTLKYTLKLTLDSWPTDDPQGRFGQGEKSCSVIADAGTESGHIEVLKCA